MSFSFGKSVPATSMNFGGGGGFSGGQNSFLSTAGQSLASSVPPATMPPSFLNPVTTPSTVTSGVGMFSVGLSAATGPAETLDSLYKDLTAPTREIVDRTYREFKAPTRSRLLELERHLGQAWTDRMAGLAKVRVRALGVETRQQQLQQVLRPNLEQARQLAREARACRAMGGGLQQIRASLSGRPCRGPDEALPAPFYKHVEQTLERRLQQVSEALRHLQRLELARRHGQGNGQRVDPSLRGPEDEALYGQAQRIGAKQLLELLQRQNEAFMRVAALAAEAHNETAAAKARFLRDRKPGQDPDPFSTADRKEQAERRLQQQKMRSECSKFLNTQASSASSTSLPSTSQTLTMTQPTGLGFGAAAVGSGITSSLPVTATSAPASGFGSGLGFSSGTTGLGSTTGGSGFGFGSAAFSTGATLGAGFGAGAGSGGFGSGAAMGTGFGSGGAATGFGSSLGLTTLSQPQPQQQPFGVGSNSLDLARLSAPTASVAGKRNKKKI